MLVTYWMVTATEVVFARRAGDEVSTRLIQPNQYQHRVLTSEDEELTNRSK